MFNDNQPTKFGGFIEMKDELLMDGPTAAEMLAGERKGRVNLVDLMKDVHANAKAHGWWDKPRGERNVRPLIVSEWIEAMEEARAMRPLIWHKCADAGNEPGVITICEKMEDCPCKADMHEVDCAAYVEKPEGIAIELMDGCIRILDWLEFLKCDEDLLPGTMESARLRGRRLIEEKLIASMDGNGNVFYDADDMPVDVLVDLLTETTMESIGGYGEIAYIRAFCMACAWVAAKGLDPEKLLLTKHAYNKGRPYKHGKAF